MSFVERGNEVGEKISRLTLTGISTMMTMTPIRMK
jgi:hypothetical protein